MNCFPNEKCDCPYSLTPYEILEGPRGSVFKLFSKRELSIAAGGELYLTEVIAGMPKWWRRHSRITCRIVVVSGAVEFMVLSHGEILSHTLSLQSGNFLEIPPGTWFCFTVSGSENRAMVMNLVNEPHDPSEFEQLPPDSKPLEGIA